MHQDQKIDQGTAQKKQYGSGRVPPTHHRLFEPKQRRGREGKEADCREDDEGEDLGNDGGDMDVPDRVEEEGEEENAEAESFGFA